ncbi:MAG: two-component regulator propeller domain-containing protein [Bacteroidota bacterium]
MYLLRKIAGKQVGISLLGLFLSYWAVAQVEPQIEVLTHDQGLPTREITSITQDANGFMWLGTSQGIVRYDGYEFVRYDSNPDNPRFIPEESIEGTMYFKSADSLWFVGNKKMYRLNIKNDGVDTFGEKAGIKGDVVAFHQDGNGEFWVIADDIDKMHKNGAHQYLQKYVHNKGFETMAKVKRGVSWFTSLTSDNAKNLWWGNIVQGLSKYDREGQLVKMLKPDSYNWFGHDLYFLKSFFDRDGRHFIFPKSTGGVDIFDKKTKKFERFLDVPHNIYHAVQDKQGNFWFAGTDSLFKVGDGTFSDLTAELKSKMDFKKITSLFLDGTGLLWMGTDGGIAKISEKKQLFDYLFVSDKPGWGNTMRGMVQLPNNTIMAKCESQRKLFVWQEDGTESEFKFNKNYEYLGQPLYDSKYFVLAEYGNQLYTVGETLIKINLSDGTVAEFDQFRPFLSLADVNPLVQLRDGRLLFGQTLKQLVLFDPESGTHRLPFAHLSNKENGIRLQFLLESKVNGKIWVATQSHGLFQVDLSGHVDGHYHTASKPRLNKNKVLVVHEDSDKGVWAGTYGGGICYLDSKRSSITVYNTNKGLPDNNITGILPYGEKGYWISTYNGLSFFDTDLERFQNFFVEDGLSHNEFNYSSFLLDSNGHYYFGGMNGINRFHPANVLNKSQLPPLALTKVVHLNQKEMASSTKDLIQDGVNSLEISPYEQYTTVHWTMPSYFKNEKHKYYTWLEGFENRWQFNGTSPFVRYNKLPAGDYVLHVRGTDSSGNTSSAEIVLPIKVRQIYYRTWWFIVLCALIALGIIYALFNLRLKQVLAIERLRSQISSDLHDQVGSMLSGLSMQTELMEMKASKNDKAQLQRIRAISRRAVVQMRDLVWSIDSRQEKVGDLVNRMQELLEEVLLPKGIAFEIKTDGVSKSKKLPAQIKQHLFLIFKEAMTNTLKHSNANTFKVTFSTHNKTSKMVIHDNGCIAKKKTNTGLGLSNMLYRATKMKGSLDIDTTNGFQITLNLPFRI